MALRLDAIGIVVTDMARALAFYRALGLTIDPAQDTEGHVEFTCENGLRLMWDTEEIIHSFAPEWAASAGDQRVGIGFACDSPAEVDATCARLAGSGYTIARAPWDAFWGQRYAQAADPDGNVVDLFAAL